MKKIKIDGKDYVMVKDRVLHFREEDAYRGWQMETEILHMDNESVSVKAIITNDLGQIISTGHAREYSKDDNVFDFAELEVCETSAIGRALGFLGIGIQDSLASADEVRGKKKYEKDDKPWLDEKKFNQVCYEMNREPDEAKRQKMFKDLYSDYKVARRYADQFEEIVKKRDIQV